MNRRSKLLDPAVDIIRRSRSEVADAIVFDRCGDGSQEVTPLAHDFTRPTISASNPSVSLSSTTMS
ncbi:MAG TPA: hypothetical protein VKA59_13980, partial [Vicinamibacterales bacterium]|nr:hypothetical protein [Vicinamibacterales bacterium]